MPGIIVSRPIFNKLFKLAHDESLSINAFLTKLLENAGPDALSPAAPARPQVSENGASPASHGLDMVGSERDAEDAESVQPEPAATRQHQVRQIDYDVEREPVGARAPMDTGERQRGRRIGDSIWDKVVSMEGQRFATSRGKRFTYKVTGDYIVVRDSQARIPRSQFDKAQKMWPVSGPSRLVGVYAPSVVWAVMHELVDQEAAAV